MKLRISTNQSTERGVECLSYILFQHQAVLVGSYCILLFSYRVFIVFSSSWLASQGACGIHDGHVNAKYQ